ncbi:MAG: hypothetical protein JSV04_09150 [Candidatus Heimdallarchaeota archaeon]|nr:MAG: hypothetical protein JSV04_09150 [Candidatus Heimdallarchaeota archaeon]
MRRISKLLQKRRAVSPVLAAILLIALAVAAAAALFFVIIPMITASTKVEIHGTPVFTNATAKIELKSTGTKSVTITDVKIEANNGSTPWPEADFNFVETTIEGGQGAILTYTFNEEFGGTITEYRVTVYYRPTDDPDATPSSLDPRTYPA